MEKHYEEIILTDTANLEGIKDKDKLEKFRIKYQELLDVIDDEGNVIGISTRGIIHRCGLRHRAVHILVYDDKDNFLLQTRGLGADRKPGRLDITAAGHVKSGELDFKESIRRELIEEVGFECINNRIEFISEYNRDVLFNIDKPYSRNRERRVLFSYALSKIEKKYLDEKFEQRLIKDEVSKMSWFSLDQVIELIHLGRVADGLRGSFLQYLAWAYKNKG